MILLGKKIKELRNKYKYTQSELASLVGVTKSTIAAYENDTRLPSYEVLIKFSHIGLSVLSFIEICSLLHEMYSLVYLHVLSRKLREFSRRIFLI